MCCCEWIGRGEGCALPAVNGRSYCEEHLWKIYAKGSAHGKRKKDIRRANAIWDLQSEFNAALEELESEGEI